MNDAELVVGILKGEIDYAVLVGRFEDRVFGWLYRLVRNSALAEELTQCVFVRAYKRLKWFDPTKGSLCTWLYTIAHNLGLNALRARRHAPESLDAMDESSGFSVPGPEELHEARERKARLFRLAAGLKPDMRDALISFALLGHPWAVVAAILRCSERHARYLVFAAIRKLRGEL